MTRHKMAAINRTDMVFALMEVLPKWGKTVSKHVHCKHNESYKRKRERLLAWTVLVEQD